ncbi:hypothetical protein [Bacillus sp. B1-b2]|uniref:hypothetical protein n=1 Tax=Bacillus sp. B1-b2 TaxID=2653201 RepID=UPI001869DD80|nr:hypothetical protein [Bacillus sp. B1-b2]
MSQFLLTNLFSALLLQRNLNWHRKLVWTAFPIFFLSLFLHGEYIVHRLKNK